MTSNAYKSAFSLVYAFWIKVDQDSSLKSGLALEADSDAESKACWVQSRKKSLERSVGKNESGKTVLWQIKRGLMMFFNLFSSNHEKDRCEKDWKKNPFNCNACQILRVAI